MICDLNDANVVYLPTLGAKSVQAFYYDEVACAGRKAGPPAGIRDCMLPSPQYIDLLFKTCCEDVGAVHATVPFDLDGMLEGCLSTVFLQPQIRMR